MDSTTVYAGGLFTSIGGQVRNRFAALDAITGAATGFNPQCDASVRAIRITGGTVYAGGVFTTVNGLPRQGVAVFP